MWYIYLIRKNNKLYTGITTDLKNRMNQHGTPEILATEKYMSKTEAAKRERQIKGWSADKKLKILTGKS